MSSPCNKFQTFITRTELGKGFKKYLKKMTINNSTSCNTSSTSKRKMQKVKDLTLQYHQKYQESLVTSKSVQIKLPFHGIMSNFPLPQYQQHFLSRLNGPIKLLPYPTDQKDNLKSEYSSGSKTLIRLQVSTEVHVHETSLVCTPPDYIPC